MFANKIDGSISFITMFCIQAIDMFINGYEGDQSVAPQYVIIYDFLKNESRFFANNRKEVIIETSILCVTIVSFLLPKRADLVENLDVCICRNLEKLLKDSHYLIQARMALFYGFFADILFKKDEQKFNDSIEFLLRSLGASEECTVVGYQA